MITDVQNDFAADAVNNLGKMVALLGVNATVESREDEDGLVLHLTTEQPGRLIGRKGRALENLEYVLNRTLGQKFGDIQPVVLDVDGYRRKRRNPSSDSKRKSNGAERPAREPIDEEEAEKLQRMALDLAKEVKRWGDAKTMGPYMAEQRKVIHTALRDLPEVFTESEPAGSNGEKNVIIKVAEGDE
jgi:spoIIIJ-associated protein